MSRAALLVSAVLALGAISTQANANFTSYESVEIARAEAVDAVARVRPVGKRKAVASLGYRRPHWAPSPIIHGVTY